MALGSKMFMDTRFLGLAYRPLELFCDAKVAVYPEDDTELVSWDPDTGLSSTPIEPVYVGWSSLTPNKDWRARNRVWGAEETSMHAYRVQLWHIDKNLLVPEEQWGDKSLRVKFGEGQRVEVLELTGDPRAVGMKLIVRNAVTDNNMWQPTLLCDIDTGDTLGTNS